MECCMVLPELWKGSVSRAVQCHIALLEAEDFISVHVREIHPSEFCIVDISIQAILLDYNTFEIDLIFMNV